MERPKAIAELLQRKGTIDDVEVSGWIRTVRKQKKIGFASIGDGSTIDQLQAVLKPEQFTNLAHGAAVRLRGSWVESGGKKDKQAFELNVEEVEVLGENDAETHPIQPKDMTPAFLRTVPHLRPRVPADALRLRLRSQAISSVTRWFNEQDFVQVHTPIVTSSDCEGAGEVFTISSRQETGHNGEAQHFFRAPKYSTVSAQLHLEALAQAVSRVWTLSPTFRAEKSDTYRHLAEFYMLEAEQCFVNELDQVMNVVEDMVRAIVGDLTGTKIADEILRSAAGQESDDIPSRTDLMARWRGMTSNDRWPRITYEKAIEALNKDGQSVSYEGGLETEHERWIATHFGQGSPVFVTDYPAAQKAFYMLVNAGRGKIRGTETVACFDLLVPEVAELAGGSLREHRSKELLEAMQRKGVAGENLEWYMDLRKYGSVPHGGFGLGFDRLLSYLSGTSNIRDVVAFPRWYGRCDC